MFYLYMENITEADPKNPRFGKKMRIPVAFNWWWRRKWNKLLSSMKAKEPCNYGLRPCRGCDSGRRS